MTGAADTMDYDEHGHGGLGADRCRPPDSVTVIGRASAGRVQVLKWVSPFKDGDDGDGIPSFGTKP